MAIASDASFTGGNATGQSTYKQPTFVDADASIKNTLALGDAQADFRGNAKSLDRAGLSRGKGTAYAAGLAGMKAMSEARNMAANTQMQTDQINSQIRQDFQFNQEMEAQKLAAAAHDITQSDWSVQNANAQALARIQAAQQSGQLQLLNALV
jgi:hypothetical protein